MKRIGADDLTRTALAKGATLVHDGGTVNPNRQRLELARQPTPMPVAELPPPLAPAKPPDTGELVAKAVRDNAQSMAMLTAALVREIRAQQSPVAAPISNWRFIVERDEQTQLLSGITAIASRTPT